MSKSKCYYDDSGRECSKCGVYKLWREFYKNSMGFNNKQSACNQCCRAQIRAYTKKYPQIILATKKRSRKKNWKKVSRSIRNQKLKNKYGLSIEEFEVLSKEQSGVCAICGLPERTSLPNHKERKPTNLAVDHCHKTNKIRGLLCSRCNTAMGLLGNDIDILASAVSYLENTAA